MKNLLCFYDMAVSPCSYDFFTFYYAAENCRIRRNLDGLDLFLVHGPENKFREDSLRTLEQNENFFHNVIVPGVSLLGSCNSFSWMSREALARMKICSELTFPRGYSYSTPRSEYLGVELLGSQIREDSPGYFRAPEYSRKMVEQFLESNSITDKYITLTVREIGRDNVNGGRSIEPTVWQEFISLSTKMGFKTFVVRDTSCAFKDPLFEGALECPIASIHLPFRLALYERAHLNFNKNNGPNVLQWFGNCDSIFFYQMDPEVVAVSPSWFESRYGMVEGSQFPMTTQNKRLLWEHETIERLQDIIENKSNYILNLNDLHQPLGQSNIQATFKAALNALIINCRFCILEEDRKLFQKLVEINAKFGLVSEQKFTNFLINSPIPKQNLISLTAF